ncbi:VolA/Pla-1 family phospholipase [Paraferrimonas haliotis]|uniref:Lipase n=1 Tax=Paraferrimonas haliotis TaxID=2013866 RepID=A0AA37WX93_9GAMM|nr:VolA/Pla-1 family phospholipase [Paraferrimonas haliotis]GLS84152.1 lipase [Paraferrimonas haliotis]
MKRLVLAAAIGTLLGVAGCGEDSHNENVENTPPLTPTARIVFDPAASALPVPNDLLFNGTTDGTLNMPGESGLEPGTMPDYYDPQTAIGALDGWSVMAPMVISIDLTTNSAGEMPTLDPASVAVPGAVRVFEAVVGGALSSDPDCAAAPSVSACKIGDELQFGMDFVTQAVGDDKFAIIPLKAYKAATSYVVAVTNMVKDSEGNAIGASASYELLKLDIDSHPLETDDQLFLQTLVNSYEKGIAEEHGVDKDTVIYSGLFTTQSAHVQFETIKGLMALAVEGEEADLAVFKPSLTEPMATGMTAAQALGLDPNMAMDPNLAPVYLAADATDIYAAKLTVPYFLELPNLQNCADAVCAGANSRWKALGHSPISILGALQSGALSQDSFGQQAVAQGIDPMEALMDPSKLVGSKFYVDYPETTMPVDALQHVTKFNPAPMPQGFNGMTAEGVPSYSMDVFITMPNETKLKAFMGDAAPMKPVTGWPTTMVLHGITGYKEAAAAIAGSYSVGGLATIAIDMPLHGSRSVDLTGNGVYDISASESLKGIDPKFANADTTVYMNLQHLLTGRDNLRQSVVDHLGLRLAISVLSQTQAAMMKSPSFDATNISLQGLSLGGIVGSGVSAYAATGLPGVDPMMNPYGIVASSLVAPGQGIGYFLVESPSFGPRIKDLLTSTDVFKGLVASVAPDCVDVPAGASPECDAAVDQIYMQFSQEFSLAAQTVVDSGDPVMYSPYLMASQTPVQLLEVVGDGMNNLPDQVIPNAVMSSPLAGTEPMISGIGLASVTDTVMGTDAPVSGAVRFIKGHHGSLLSPAPSGGATAEEAAAATAEMQSQVVTYAASKGMLFKVMNKDVIKQD